MYCQILGHAGIASFLRAPSTPSFLMKFGIWVPNMIIFVLVYGLGGGCLVQKIARNGGQSELKLLGRSEKNFLCNFNHSYLAIRTVKLHKIFYHMFSYKFSTRSYSWNLKKTIFDRFVVNALELAVLNGFWRKNAKEL